MRPSEYDAQRSQLVAELIADRSCVGRVAEWICKHGGPWANAQAEVLELVYHLTSTVGDVGADDRARLESRLQTLMRFGVKPFGPYRVLRLAPELSFEFAWIPPGTFMMGNRETDPSQPTCDEHDGYRRCEGPQHQVTLTRGFWMGVVPVTQLQFGSVVGRNPSWCSKGAVHGPDEHLPVQEVTPEDVADFLERVNGRQSEARFRLPTEAEWEYACRAGTTTRYWSGNEESDLARVGWYEENSRIPTFAQAGQFRQIGVIMHSVGMLLPNPFGLYDMHGNVWEYCADHCDSDDHYYARSPAIDPCCLDEEHESRVIRGGDAYDEARDCTSSARDAMSLGSSHNDLGFRIVAEFAI